MSTARRRRLSPRTSDRPRVAFRPLRGVETLEQRLCLAADVLLLYDTLAGHTPELIAALEDAVLHTPGIDGVVLRYGRLYGPGTWFDKPGSAGALTTAAAAQAALLAVTRGAPGLYNIAEDDGEFSIEKARTALGFDPSFRMP